MAQAISIRSVSVNGIQIEMMERGEGRPLLFLHPAIGIEPEAPVLHRLGGRARLIAPVHPGFGASQAPRSFDSIDDLAYFYLDLLDVLQLDDVSLVAISFGGWIAAEILVKNSRASGMWCWELHLACAQVIDAASLCRICS